VTTEVSHTLVPDAPVDGQRFACSCGETFEFVILQDGLPGEWVWVSTAPDQ
jgi:hypothetical protein